MPLREEHDEFIKEAEKWSVLFVERETKIKDEFRREGFEYILNPIYAPYFNITYRKRRKLELTTDDFIVLAGGDYEEVKNLLKRYSRKWEVDLEQSDPGLFSHLVDEDPNN